MSNSLFSCFRACCSVRRNSHKYFQSFQLTFFLADTEVVKNATATLNKNYYNSPASLNALLQVLCGHPDKGLKQLAAVEARKLVVKHWAALPEDQKASLRNQLLQFTLNEDSKL